MRAALSSVRPSLSLGQGNGQALGAAPTDGPSYGLVRVVRDVSDPREICAYQADALTGELAEMLAQGWKVEDPSALGKLGLRLDANGRLIDL